MRVLDLLGSGRVQRAVAEEDFALCHGLLDFFPDGLLGFDHLVQGEAELLGDALQPSRWRYICLDERERHPLLQQPRAGSVADLPELLVGEPSADDPAAELCFFLSSSRSLRIQSRSCVFGGCARNRTPARTPVRTRRGPRGVAGIFSSGRS